MQYVLCTVLQFYTILFYDMFEFFYNKCPKPQRNTRCLLCLMIYKIYKEKTRAGTQATTCDNVTTRQRIKASVKKIQ